MPRPLSVTVRKPSAVELDLDEGGVAGQRLVHRVVDDFGEQVMQRLFVGAADIHARAAPDRLQPFQDLNVARGIAGFCTTTGAAGGDFQGSTALRAGSGKEIIGFGFC